MKKKVLLLIGSLAFVAVMFLNANISKTDNNEITLSNLFSLPVAFGEDQLCDFCYSGGTGCTMALGLPGGIVYHTCDGKSWW